MSKLNRRETRTLVALLATLGLIALAVLFVAVHSPGGEVSMTFNFTLAVMILAGVAAFGYWALCCLRYALTAHDRAARYHRIITHSEN